MTAEKIDPLRAEPLRRDHARQADGTVADDSDGFAGADPRGEIRMVACPITSESVRSDGINASSRPTGRTTSLPSASGTARHRSTGSGAVGPGVRRDDKNVTVGGGPKLGW